MHQILRHAMDSLLHDVVMPGRELLVCSAALDLLCCAALAAQPVDLKAYSRIHLDGTERSRVMEYASALVDGIGSRLTGSPNLRRAGEWAREQLSAMGCTNARLENWGEFGMGWRQRHTSVRMTDPDVATLIAQAEPWSPATKGAVRAPLAAFEVSGEADFEKYRGKLAGKIVLWERAAPVSPLSEPLFRRYDDKRLADFARDPVDGPRSGQYDRGAARYFELQEKAGRFFAAEGAVAVLLPSRNNSRHGATGGTIYLDTNETFGWFVYRRDRSMQTPLAVIAAEHYGRLSRLLKSGVPVTIEANIDTEFTGDHEPGFNVLAELPGSELKDEVVMLGAHLDSWHGGTGAADNGAGTVVAMEAMRILRAAGLRLRRTVRIALWGGEEQGMLASRAYVARHFGSFAVSGAAEHAMLPEFMRPPAGPLVLKPDHDRLSVYFNLDMGSGRIRGVTTTHNAALVPIFEQWIAPLRDLGVTTVSSRADCGSDCASFDAIGIPAPAFIQDPLDYDTRAAHTNMDTYERLVPEDLRQAAIVLATFVYNAANSDGLLPRKPLPRPELRVQPAISVMPAVPR
jgi:carboxypeptidase Q